MVQVSFSVLAFPRGRSRPTTSAKSRPGTAKVTPLNDDTEANVKVTMSSLLLSFVLHLFHISYHFILYLIITLLFKE